MDYLKRNATTFAWLAGLWIVTSAGWLGIAFVVNLITRGS